MTVFLTFRLADSMPAEVVRAYAEERRIVERRLVREGPTPELLRDARFLFSTRIEEALDSGIGACVLRRSDYAQIVTDSLLFFNGERYVLHAFCVMPNHVHVVFTLAPDWPLSKVSHSWKSFSANGARSRLGHVGSLWQDESYDHIVRDAGELAFYIQYTLDNPTKAGFKDWPYVFDGSQRE